jgi:hypothetical protein
LIGTVLNHGLYGPPWLLYFGAKELPRASFRPLLSSVGGTEFAALLVKASYKPEATRGTIPDVGGDVIAVAKKKPEKK